MTGGYKEGKNGGAFPFYLPGGIVQNRMVQARAVRLGAGQEWCPASNGAFSGMQSTVDFCNRGHITFIFKYRNSFQSQIYMIWELVLLYCCIPLAQLLKSDYIRKMETTDEILWVEDPIM